VKLRLEIEIECGDTLIDPSNILEVNWLLKDILIPSDLRVFSNEIGGDFGDVISVANIKILP